MNIFQGIGYTAIYFVVYFFFSLFHLFALYLFSGNDQYTYDEIAFYLSLTSLFEALMFGGIVFLFLTKNRSAKLKEIFQSKRNFTFIIALILSVIFGYLIVIIQPSIFGYDNCSFDLNSVNSASQLILFLRTVLLIPIIEETFFRGFILTRIKVKYSTGVSIAISAILFALIHTPNIDQMIVTAFGGIIAGVLFTQSKSLIPPILFHSVWNFFAFIC